jgi:hypothetical protein
MSQQKTREERERELVDMLRSEDGLDQIVSLYEKVMGIPDGSEPPVGTLARQQMIPAILDSEYPPQGR